MYDDTDPKKKLEDMDAEEIEEGLVHHFWIVKDGKIIDDAKKRLLETMPSVAYIDQKEYSPVKFLEDVEVIKELEE